MAAFSEIVMEQGTTFITTVNVEDTLGAAINLYGYTAQSQMRKSYYSSSAITIDANITENSSGEITLSMSSINTSNVKAGRYVYDLIITDADEKVTRVVEGIVNVLPAVTR